MSAKEVSGADFNPSQEVRFSFKPSPKVSLPKPGILPEAEGIAFRIKALGSEALQFLNDEQWMSYVTDLFAMASHICSLMAETRATQYVPYLSIFSSPFYLRHAVKESIQRFKLMVSACKTSRVADALFWGGGAVGSFGSAVGDVTKPVAGGVTLAGLSSIAALHTTFSFVIPIILIAFSVIGGINQGWALGNTEMALQRLKQRKEGLQSLKDIDILLNDLQGPQKPLSEDPLAKHHFKLDVKDFQSTHFTSIERREAVQNKIRTYLGSQRTGEAIEPARAALARILPLIQQAQIAASTEGSLFEKIDETLSLSEQTIRIAQERELVVNDLICGRDDLIKLKKQVYEGYTIIDTVHSEIHRKIAYQNIGILNALMTLGAGMLFLIAPQSQYYLGYILSFSASAVGAINVIFDKRVSQECFLQMEQFLGTIETRDKPKKP